MKQSCSMKIVLLDGDPALGSGPSGVGKVDAGAIGELGKLTVFDRTQAHEVVERARDAEIVLTNKVRLGATEFAQLPRLKMISVLATGVNVIDLTAASEHGVTVCNVPGYSTASTAQHAFALLLELTNRVGLHSSEVRQGGWSQSPAFAFFHTPLIELDGLTLGIVGFGEIGRRMAEIGKAFGMQVLAHTRSPKQADGVTFVSKQELLQSSDVVTLHCPLTDETKHWIDEDALSTMKPSALLLNVSRGPVVDEMALVAALERRQIAGAAVDVLDEEPAREDHPLCLSPFCLVTPHIAWASTTARERLLQLSAENIRAFAEGRPVNVVARPAVSPD